MSKPLRLDRLAFANLIMKGPGDRVISFGYYQGTALAKEKCENTFAQVFCRQRCREKFTDFSLLGI